MSKKQKTWLIIGIIVFVVILGLILDNKKENTQGGGQKTETAKYSDSPSQNTFDALSCAFARELKAAANSIRKEEVHKEYLQKYKNFFNSTPHIDGWKGEICSIKEEKGEIENVGENWILYKKISFGVEVKNSDRTATTFVSCTYKFPNDDADNDAMFNAIKNIADYSKVYVSGNVTNFSNGEVALYYDERLDGFVLGLTPTKIEALK